MPVKIWLAFHLQGKTQDSTVLVIASNSVSRKESRNLCWQHVD